MFSGVVIAIVCPPALLTFVWFSEDIAAARVRHWVQRCGLGTAVERSQRSAAASVPAFLAGAALVPWR
jgi:hypothetical protein